jgi:hypothetical protein
MPSTGIASAARNFARRGGGGSGSNVFQHVPWEIELFTAKTRKSVTALCQRGYRRNPGKFFLAFNGTRASHIFGPLVSPPSDTSLHPLGAQVGASGRLSGAGAGPGSPATSGPGVGGFRRSGTLEHGTLERCPCATWGGRDRASVPACRRAGRASGRRRWAGLPGSAWLHTCNGTGRCYRMLRW